MAVTLHFCKSATDMLYYTYPQPHRISHISSFLYRQLKDQRMPVLYERRTVGAEQTWLSILI